MLKMIKAGFEGLGASPEIMIIAGGAGMISSDRPLSLSFDLEDLRKHDFFIEHDCSFSREDAAIGNNNDFNQTIWDVALAELNKSSTVAPIAMGRAKVARVRDERRRNPKTLWGPRAAAFSVMQSGLVLALGGGYPKLEWVRSLFEEERIPTHLGWRPVPFLSNAITTLGFGTMTLQADPKLLAAGTVLNTPRVSTSFTRLLRGEQLASRLI
ncbi:hypothetical protein CDD83_5905 [Cordyceps sp. RAO-2017]|nr:hypothetical protein CDD83_5905 [Cordyceps sp. RAO-2017]